jgi:hypothetical protein
MGNIGKTAIIVDALSNFDALGIPDIKRSKQSNRNIITTPCLSLPNIEYIYQNAT